MSDFYFGLIMFICVITMVLISFFTMYPRKWKEKKIILGVNFRPEFMVSENIEKVNSIVKNTNKNATIVSILCIVIACVLLALRGFKMQTFVWLGFLYLSIIALLVPYIIGHSQMMALKKELGLYSEKGVSYVDLNMVGKIKTMSLGKVLIPNIIGLVIWVFIFLCECKVINIDIDAGNGSFIGTIVVGIFWLTGLLLTFISFMMDNLKNEVISTDSDINANYNRAKKKNFADFNVRFLWINTLYILIIALSIVFMYSDVVLMIGVMVYIVPIMVICILSVSAAKKIEARYKNEMEFTLDDDENWIGGMFYYNPSDNRLNIEKRMGIGTTVNFAHPAGKVLGVFIAVCLVGALASVVWVGMLEATPINIRLEDKKVICHQLRDEYVIELDNIKDAEYKDDLDELKLVRVNGTGMSQLLKGNFTVDGQKKCKLFLAPKDNVYIKIATEEGTTYYISGIDKEETKEVYDEIVSEMK
ncbi:MAG: DUF5808 domain-containing protein [Lachnospiraceae bacterium]|nr:DUF5808 domain-containing protein [Lachnospiraceae bacterium]